MKENYPENTIRLGEEMKELFLGEILPLFLQKNSNYTGNGQFDNIDILGEKGVLARAVDKVARLYNILWVGIPNFIEDEKVEDTWMDLAVYSLIAILVRRGLWRKES